MKKKVKDLMSNKIIAVLPSDSVMEVAFLMSEHHIGAVPVVSAGEIKGMVTDRDIVLRCVAQNKNTKDIKASEIMSDNIAFVTPDQSINDAAEIMANEQIRRLPVLTDGYISGIISLADIARQGAEPEIAKAICEISRSNIGHNGAIKFR